MFTKRDSEFKLALLVILIALVGRALFLEYTDLVDPTEARYASVAQEMVLSHDWLTPKLPDTTGISNTPGMIAYNSKPPLHYWLTAISYSLFGMDEWSSRAPSFLAALLTLWLIFSVTRTFTCEKTGLTAALIAVSSGMFFFLAGASVTDVTLTALLSLGTVSFYRFAADPKAPRRYGYLCAFATGLAFLCKGPLSLVLVAFPIVLWSLVARDWGWIKRLPWLGCIVVFLLVAGPWFLVNEYYNPGFSWYFFWNENIGRFLYKDYGDRYGAGHPNPYGMSWLMLLAAFSPWSLVLLGNFLRLGLTGTKNWIFADRFRIFALCWGISAALFFTFVKHLHAMYLLPGIPGLAITTALLLHSCPSDPKKSAIRWVPSFAPWIAIVFWAGIVVAGVILEFSLFALILGSAISLAGFIFLSRLSASHDLQCTRVGAGLVIGTYLVVLACLTPHINERRSADNALKELAVMTLTTPGVARVGVLANNSYSHHWSARAWKTELKKELTVEYVAPEHAAASDINYYLIRARSPEGVPAPIRESFSMVKQVGDWRIFLRNP